MKLAYLAGPYTAQTPFGEFLNVVTARVWAEEVMKKGYAVYVPHLQNFASGLSWDEIMSRDLEVLSRCDLLVLLPGWENSKGSQMEHQKALDLEMPVCYNVSDLKEAK